MNFVDFQEFAWLVFGPVVVVGLVVLVVMTMIVAVISLVHRGFIQIFEKGG